MQPVQTWIKDFEEDNTYKSDDKKSKKIQLCTPYKLRGRLMNTTKRYTSQDDKRQ